MDKDKGNVVVVCRFRPPNRMEREMGSNKCIEVAENHTVYLDTSDLDGSKKSSKKSKKKGKASKSSSSGTKTVFSFDHVFEPEASQEEVFDGTAARFSHEIMRGFNCTIFAYGQTGSGKTFTMMGPHQAPGIIPRLTSSIFDLIDESDDQLEFTVKLSYVEIYMERVKDLLDPGLTNLRIREGSRGVWIQDVTEQYVSTREEVLDVMAVGETHRHTAATSMNDYSSRSHSVFMMTVGQRNKATGSKKGAKMILVDLAGSETVRKTGASGQTLKEAQHINKSLSALGNVINSLTTGSPHVPYRDSKLTRLLMDSLGGNSKTCLIVTASPVSFNLEETISTLRFGTRAKKIKNKPIVNQEKSVAEYKALLKAAVDKCAEQEAIIEELKAEVAKLREALRSGGGLPGDEQELQDKEALLESASGGAAAGDGVDSLAQKAKSSSTVLHNLELQGQVQVLERDNREKEELLQQLQEELMEKERQLEQVQDEVEVRDERILNLQKAVFESAKAEHSSHNLPAKADSGGADEAAEQAEQGGADSVERNHQRRLSADTRSIAADAGADLLRRLEELEQQNAEYSSRIEELREQNMELSKTTSMRAVAAEAAAESGKTVPLVVSPASSPPKQARQLPAEEDSDSDFDEAPAAGGSAEAEQLRTLQTNYEVLMAALGRKCEQYITLQMDMQKQSKQLAAAERQLQQVQSSTSAESEIAELRERLEASDKLCQKLFQSGVYWQERGKRKEQELEELKALRQRELSQAVPDATGNYPDSIRFQQQRQRMFEQQQKGAGRSRVGSSQHGRGAGHRIVKPVHVSGGKKHSGGAVPALQRQGSMDAFF